MDDFERQRGFSRLAKVHRDAVREVGGGAVPEPTLEAPGFPCEYRRVNRGGNVGQVQGKGRGSPVPPAMPNSPGRLKRARAPPTHRFPALPPGSAGSPDPSLPGSSRNSPEGKPVAMRVKLFAETTSPALGLNRGPRACGIGLGLAEVCAGGRRRNSHRNVRPSELPSGPCGRRDAWN